MPMNILLLQATSTRNPDKLKLLLENGAMAHVPGDLLGETESTSAQVAKIVENAIVPSVTWRWPGGSAHRNVCGVNGQMILGLLKQKGVPTTFDTVYTNAQVPDGLQGNTDWAGREDHLEIVLAVPEQSYNDLSNQYGTLAVVNG